MKIIYSFLLVVQVSFYSVSFSQKISNKVLSNFSKSLTINMYNDVLSKMDFNDDLQYQLATLYANRDSLIFVQLTKPVQTINYNKYADSISYNRYADSLLYAIEVQFKKLLIAEQKREYFLKVERARAVNYPIIDNNIYMDVEMDSQFGLALALFDKFNLKPKQKDSLIYYATILKQKEVYTKLQPDSGYFDKAAFESENMPKVLTELEYNGLLSIKNKVVAETNSKNTWYNLKKDNLVADIDRTDTLFQLKMYYLIKATLWDKFAHQPQFRNILLQNLKPPYILQKALAIRNETEAKLKKYNW
jgi:hypothetical protein